MSDLKKELDEPYKERFLRLARYVISTEVYFKQGNYPDIDKQWMLDNIGEQRHSHPYHEAEEGWIDYFEGEWAVDFTIGGYNFYWFANKKLTAIFVLMYSGNASWDVRCKTNSILMENADKKYLTTFK
jgi:hypothetical protein